MANYKDIELTEEEMVEAIILAKSKKAKLLEQKKLLEKQEANRINATKKWDFDVIRTFMINRAKSIFKFDFVLDDENIDVFDMLCYYFISDQYNFEKYASRIGLVNPSINKGILMCGNFGTGKSVLMQLFQRNNRQVYYVRSSKRIAIDYTQSKPPAISEEYLEPFKLAINDPSTMYQVIAGLCIDDLGAESVKNNFGNKINVIGDLIEERHLKGYVGPLLHGTTNLSSVELNEFYGERVISRMRQDFNFFELPGNDRRK